MPGIFVSWPGSCVKIRMRNINDWRLEEEILAGKHTLVVGFVSRLDPGHRGFVEKVVDLERRFGDDAEFFVVDLVEHPGLVRKLKPESLPMLVVWAHEREVGRWSGRMDMRIIAPKVASAIK